MTNSFCDMNTVSDMESENRIKRAEKNLGQLRG